MKKLRLGMLCLLPAMLILSGCNTIGDKAASISIVYVVTTVLSLIMLVGYFTLLKKKELWFYILFASVFVVNMGYFLLSVSKTLEMALWANRLAYLGSVFLPLSMIMIIWRISGLRYGKCVPGILAAISVLIFLVAASPGYLDIYYKSATLETVNGVSVLVKEYGTWHSLYLFYLLGYLAIMICTIVQAIVKKKLESVAHAVVLIVAVFVNICVWLLEQLVRLDFEFLSVSYIITELFLLSASLMMQHQEVLISSLQNKLNAQFAEARKAPDRNSHAFWEHCRYVMKQLPRLTPSERAIYDCYLAGKSTKEVLQEMNIGENTLKFHNKNLYGKLGVSSRKQLLEYANAINEMAERK